MIIKNSKFKVHPANGGTELKIFAFCLLVLSSAFCVLNSSVLAVSPTPTPSVTDKITPTGILGSTAPTPTTAEDTKVKEIRDAIKEKVNEIKEKIEKRAYVGIISQITDSTITLDNFRGKRRVRITETTSIIGTAKKEIKAKDLSLEDKVIALGIMGDNEILEAKRIIVVPKPKTVPAKRVVIFGSITTVDSKNSTITVTPTKNQDQTIELKFEKETILVSQADPKANLKLKDLKESQKVIVVHLEVAPGKIAVAKSLSLLP